MVGCIGESLEVPQKRFGCPSAERSDDLIALVAGDLDRGEGLVATLAPQLAATRRSEVANPIGDPILRQEIRGPVDLDREERDVAWRASAPARNREDGDEPYP
jgi:hypothetical protein